VQDWITDFDDIVGTAVGEVLDFSQTGLRIIHYLAGEAGNDRIRGSARTTTAIGLHATTTETC
jgi:hypothetical protein